MSPFFDDKAMLWGDEHDGCAFLAHASGTPDPMDVLGEFERGIVVQDMCDVCRIKSSC
jgi:hypothetical protein